MTNENLRYLSMALNSKHFKRRDCEINIEIDINTNNISSFIILIAGNWREIFIKVSGKVKKKAVNFKGKIGQVTVISHHSHDFVVCVHGEIRAERWGLEGQTMAKESV